ncbi:MAG: winged helix-turn-helix domain-containing protein [Candidatus Bathyarchaeota archaeon]|nr:winged helix-turn-helix domain-containing protein [Candidatus Bathyarchaeum sp.]
MSENFKVYVNGALLTVNELKKQYQELSVSVPQKTKIINILNKTTKPLTRKELANLVGTSSVSIAQALDRLISDGLIIDFKLGRRLFYLLTEKGLIFCNKK